MGFGTIGGANPDNVTLEKNLAGALQIMGSALNKLLASDTTGGATAAATYTQVGSTLTIGAGVVKDHILIFATVNNSLYDGNQSGNSEADFDIRVDDVSKKETAPMFFTNAYGGTKTYIAVNTIMFYYAPTALQKANGFTVKFFGKNTSSGVDRSATVTLQNSYVLGG